MKVRVVGLEDGLGNKKYIVQWKTFLFWHTIKTLDVIGWKYETVNREFKNYLDAEFYAKDHVREHLAKKRKVVSYHYFGDCK
jgi:hypothetical protein